MNRRTIIVSMPVYNSEDTLANAIESVLRQTYSNLHLVITDDCSTDNSLKIAKHYAKLDSRVSVYSNNENMGAYYCRNVGLYVNRNKPWGYFTTHDADDISYEDRYHTLLKALNKKVNGVQDIFTRKDLKSGKILSEKMTMAHALFTRNVFDAIGYFEQVRFGGDWEYWTRLKYFNRLNGFAVTGCEEVLGESFVHTNNLTTLIPVNSSRRKLYINKTLKRLKKAKVSFYTNHAHGQHITKSIT